MAAEVVALPLDPRDKLRRYVALHLRHYYESRDRHTVLIEDADHLPAQGRAAVERSEQQLVAMLVSLLQQIQPERLRDHHLATADAMLIYGMLNWTYTWYRPSGRLTLDALADRATRLCLYGIAGDASPGADPDRVVAR